MVPSKKLLDHQILAGLNLLLHHDPFLLENGLNERTITHRLGMYYQDIFPHCDVDCEYNLNIDVKMGTSVPKGSDFDIPSLLKKMSELISRQLDVEVNVRMTPDFKLDINSEDLASLRAQLNEPGRIDVDPITGIAYFLLDEYDNGKFIKKKIYPDIVVHHRGEKNNHIVIEAKRANSSHNTPRSRAYDLYKLLALTTDKKYQYEAGYLVTFPKTRSHVFNVTTARGLGNRIRCVE